MKNLIEKLFKPVFENTDETEETMAVDLATAILMIEVSKADFEQDNAEIQYIRQLLASHLRISAQEIDDLVEAAHKEADRLVSVQHITRLMNEKMSQGDKLRVIELMWKVAYADGEKHHYEEHLLRQVADLLYVPHADFIRARHQAEDSA
jgi:uncharacterized tellurite resistance protein B-like protein